MTAYFGRRWVMEYGEAPNPIWVKELLTITPRQASIGVQALKDRGTEHPPSLPAFFKLAKATKPPMPNVETTRLMLKQSGEMRSSRDVARAALASLKRSVKQDESCSQS